MKTGKLVLFDYGYDFLQIICKDFKMQRKKGDKKLRSSKYNFGLLCCCVSLSPPQRATRGHSGFQKCFINLHSHENEKSKDRG